MIGEEIKEEIDEEIEKEDYKKIEKESQIKESSSSPIFDVRDFLKRVDDLCKNKKKEKAESLINSQNYS